MAIRSMIEILDCLKLIVNRWVDTKTPITSDVNPGDTILSVGSTRRFTSGDEIMLQDSADGEPNLIIEHIVDFTHIQLATPVLNRWTVAQNTIVNKLTNGMFIQGVYLGKNNIIPMYPAVEINGTTIGSEFMTLGSYKDRFEVELTVMVEASTREDGYRFLIASTAQVLEGLRQNFYPLVNDYAVVSLTEDVSYADQIIRCADSSIFYTGLTKTSSPYPWLSDARAILEDSWKCEETRVQQILSPTDIVIRPGSCNNYLVSNGAIIICPHRFLFNTWPHVTDIGTLSKEGTLLQTAVIRWFAEEEVVYDFHNNDPHLK